jgi:hypothetical protein
MKLILHRKGFKRENVINHYNIIYRRDIDMLQYWQSNIIVIYRYLQGQSWSWSYGSLIYNYLCNQCDLWVVSSNPVHGEVYSIQHYVIKFVGDLWQVSGFLRVLQSPPPIILVSTILLKYCWKHHKPTNLWIFTNEDLRIYEVWFLEVGLVRSVT